MSINNNSLWTYAMLGALGIFGPILFPDYTLSIAYLWMMVLMASTWDTLGLSLIHISEPTRPY